MELFPIFIRTNYIPEIDSVITFKVIFGEFKIWLKQNYGVMMVTQITMTQVYSALKNLTQYRSIMDPQWVILGIKRIKHINSTTNIPQYLHLNIIGNDTLSQQINSNAVMIQMPQVNNSVISQPTQKMHLVTDQSNSENHTFTEILNIHNLTLNVVNRSSHQQSSLSNVINNLDQQQESTNDLDKNTQLASENHQILNQITLSINKYHQIIPSILQFNKI